MVQMLPVMGGFVISEANSSRSRAWAKIAHTAALQVIPAGTLLKGTLTQLAPATVLPALVAGDIATICGIAVYTTYIGVVDDEQIAVLARDAEVNEAKIIYGGLIAADVAVKLASLGIMVRPAVLDGPGGTYAGGPRTSDPALDNTIYDTGGIANATVAGGVYSR